MSSYPGYSSAPPRNSGPSVIVILAIVGVVAFIGLALLVGAGVYMFSKVANDSQELKQVFSDDGLTSLMVPKNWNQIPSQYQNPDATLQQANVFGERYVIVISERISDFAEAPAWASELLEVKSVDDYGELVLAQMSAGMSVQKKGKSMLKINGMDAVRHKFHATFDGVDIVYWITFVKGENHYHQIMAWTTQSYEEKNEQSLLSISDSFDETH